MRFQTVGMVTIMGHILAFFAAKMEKAEQLLKSPCLVNFLVAGGGFEPATSGPRVGISFRACNCTGEEDKGNYETQRKVISISRLAG